MTPPSQEYRLKLRKLLGKTRISKVYDAKAVRFGDRLDVFEYTKTQVTFFRERGEVYPRKKNAVRTSSSISRARSLVVRIIEANVYENRGQFPPVFFTMTYRDDVRELKIANSDFHRFTKRLNRRIGKKAQYLAVPEFTKRGRIHYHVVYFNLPYVDKSVMQDIWSHGFTRIEAVANIRNNALYLAKYFSKSAKDRRLVGKKTYFTSKGLARPVDYYGTNDVRDVIRRDSMSLRGSFNFPTFTLNKYVHLQGKKDGNKREDG